MMSKFIVRGGKRLTGSVKVSGAKNSVLPIIAASLLGEEGQSVIIDAPPLDDVMTINKVLESLGAGVTYRDEVITVNAEKLTSCEAPYEWVSKMRASFLVMGPLLTRMGHTRISLPGGCAIGTRPIDQHLKGFEAMGAEISLGQGYIEARSQGRLRGAKIYLDVASVGATQNIMMAATLAEGVTVLENAAKEPEIVDLANFLNGMGAKVRGAGTGVIRIEGVEKLSGVKHTVIPDRVEAGTYMAAAAISGGDVYIEGAISDHLGSVIAKLEEMGVTIHPDENGVRVIADRPLKAVDVKTLPYPGFPTDMQSQMMALLLASEGTSVVTETVFENRFMHVDEFQLMNAEIKVEGRSSIITGNAKLKGAKVTATDLRAGAALIIAGLVAEGTTEVGGVHHIDRGYVHLAEKLNGLGADIYRISVEEPKLDAVKASNEKVGEEVPLFKVQPTWA
ncbi:UDP-N-acetylglucosamine 1-carboxyvinyltransferase [Paenibacillus sp. ov031]|jgi:UDP-N-acetylglucosamine 1-carboxyvinyltransferase|uniref:UDP-N-acetylglucosamine 1-carboxyvinyltransferase n=2 Tax=Paenibacillus TaxID=44249 RepID=A0A855Y8U1_9BACL|nr:UDP-N-acetylglucosamine 1-carboxyvinyltransferase 1 [Paenibacillus sp. AD87]OME85828.1 UDP-N-acetylglucosamine 1-carboxyvinyltransferase [Paenibacillus pabuli]PXW05447.1 UDP-N-acetylglucosamine 1-carboxyvinyltransferase [Paenibacillus taichungensis]SDK88183.1 UDP-N-acetylglucosamine 1-carboxyvinyltransferase [Paenibacillus sp. OK060]SEB17641.1 UDP-N-acetylglucosamine 1-carboxyvinyltransferase [Paenibacillus sp. 276b]SEL75665.1 UDP-N-acetylglucosamine 1-carboxyvinyltransferase [Paenibacillus